MSFFPIIGLGPPGEPVAGMKGWFTPASIQQSASVVTGWNDVSGNALHLGTAAGSPAYLASAINGLAGVDFDGTDDRVSSSANYSAFISDAAYSIYIVANVDAIDTNDEAGQTYNNDGFCGDNAVKVGPGLRSAPTVHFGHRDSAFQRTSSITISTGTAYIFAQRFDGSSITGRINTTSTEVTASATTVAASDIGTALNIGRVSGSADYWLDGKVCELIFYNTALSAANHRTNLEYLAAKYGLALA